MNRNRRWLQVLIVLLGALYLALAINQGYQRGALEFASKTWERTMKGLSKPAELGIFALVGLYAVRRALKSPNLREKLRAFYRLLQVIHVPLAIVVLASAVLHGLLFFLYRWKNDFHSWSGVAALTAMVVAVIAGLLTLPRPGRKQVHLTLGLLTFAIALVHVVTA